MSLDNRDISVRFQIELGTRVLVPSELHNTVSVGVPAEGRHIRDNLFLGMQQVECVIGTVTYRGARAPY